MHEIIFRGKFECQDAQLFINEFNEFLNRAQAKYQGQIQDFNVEDFDDYEEIVEDEEKKDSNPNIQCSDNSN